MRGAKPNFTMGSHKLDYMSENKGRLASPGVMTVNKEDIEHHKAQQRKHNFKMSFEQGSQFETDRNKDRPYRLPASGSNQDRSSVKKGSSNVHQVQIGHLNTQNDYKSLTALQQNGYKDPLKNSRNGMASYTEART